MDADVAPLQGLGVEITPILRRGNSRDVIVQVATNLKADLLIVGSHSKRGLMDIALGGTAQQVGKTAPCPVVLVSPKLAGGGGGSSPQCAVKSLSGHPACFLARFRELLLHLLSMRPLPLIVLRHIEVTFACTPDLVLLGQ
jgi:hypothetical protein